jgi:hypothetical protein
MTLLIAYILLEILLLPVVAYLAYKRRFIIRSLVAAWLAPELAISEEQIKRDVRKSVKAHMGKLVPSQSWNHTWWDERTQQ